MEFNWTSEHHGLRESVRRILDDRAPLERARQLADDGERYDAELWSTLAGQMGLQGLTIPEEQGGSGASRVELAIVMDEMGSHLYGGPFVPTVVFAVEALIASGDPAACDEFLPQIAAGDLTATLAVVEGDTRWREASLGTVATGTSGDRRLTGSKELVLDGQDAGLILVAARSDAGISLYAVQPDADGLSREPLNVLDGTRRMARVVLRNTPARLIGEDGGAWPAIEQVRRSAAILLAAEQVGAMAHLVAVTGDYANSRRQFGRPVGMFQGVKHRLADMAVRLEMARSAAYWAAWQDRGSPDEMLGAAVAGSYCSEALMQTAKDTIQLHGGIGFTWEHDAHLFLRRARADCTLAGSPAAHRAALGELVAPDLAGAAS